MKSFSDKRRLIQLLLFLTILGILTLMMLTQNQKSITKGVVAEVNDLGLKEYAKKYKLMNNYNRNKNLVELSKDEIPEDIWTNIVYEYNNANPKGDFMKVTQFISKHKIKTFEDKISQFLY